jgi:hypothetical protein
VDPLSSAIDHAYGLQLPPILFSKGSLLLQATSFLFFPVFIPKEYPKQLTRAWPARLSSSHAGSIRQSGGIGSQEIA